MTQQLRPEISSDLFSSFSDAPLSGESGHNGAGSRVLDSLAPFQGLVSDHVVAGQPVKPENGAAADQTKDTKPEPGENFAFVAESAVMRKVRSQTEALAKLDIPVLIVGETGTGKEVVGRLIHSLSNRSANRFLKVNCAADPDALERGLFDDEKGRNSDEAAREISPFVLCNEGTVLLDDIDEMPTRAQAKLLCLLQDKQFFSSGARPVHVDVRILAATKTDIKTALLNGKLRRDLYYCLSAFTILVPPLRQRKDDIPMLLKHLMNRVASDYGLPARFFSPAVLLACQKYSWPGNLRELEKFVKRYLVSGEAETTLDCDEAYSEQDLWQAEEAERSVECLQNSSAVKSLLHTVREEAERNAITNILEQTRWNRRAAARLLQVSYRTLLNKIQQYDMSPRKR
jgi:two-component system, NtrC family, response regulator AtoC